MRDSSIFEWIMREERNGNIYQEVDGYWVWAPNSGYGGFYNEYSLTKILEYLKAKNAPWDWMIQNDPVIGRSEHGTYETEAKP
jgi:hypothetical protein